MSAAPKKKDDELHVDTSDREQKLSKNFEDPALAELIPGLGGSDPHLSVVEEAAEAVQELTQEATKGSGSAVDLSAEFSQQTKTPTIMTPEEAEPVDALPLPEGFEDLPIPPPAPEPAKKSAAPIQGKASRPLPTTVNPNPDVLERSMFISRPKDDELALEGHVHQVEQDNARSHMAEALFALVACERNFDELTEKGLRAIIDGVDALTGSILELDHEREDFFFRASFGGTTSHTKLKAFRVPINKGIVGHVAESGQSLLIRNLADDEKQMRAISLSVGFEAVTCMAAPILVGGQPYGVIEVFNKRDGGLFGEEDLRVLEEGVRMLAKVLEVRFLLAELSRRAR